MEERDKYEITEEGSLGLLALGARGTGMWREATGNQNKLAQGKDTRVPPKSSGEKKKKLLLIGWDAADWQVIRPLMQQGKMPALKQLTEKGIQGNIATLQPPLSPMLWTSIATGKRAYDHGIYGFVETDLVKGAVEPVKASSRKVKALWSILNEAGLKTNVVNWWPSHPVEKIDGVMVSDRFHKGVPAIGKEWPMDESAVFPEVLFEEIRSLRLHPAELTLAHIWPFIPEAHELDPEKDAVLKPLLRILAKCCSVHNTVTYLMENTEWDMTAVYYEALDHFSHLAMKYHPPKQQGIGEEEFRLYKNIVEAAYRFHDMMLQRLLDLAGESCHIMLVSDHGFHSGSLRVPELPHLPAAPALEHRKYGIFAAAGPAFAGGRQIYGSTLLDITPSILHFFELPVGEDMEGRVRREIWKKPGRESRIPSWEYTLRSPAFVNDKSDNTEVLKQLEELGYVDLPQSDKGRYAGYELDYNLCLSYIDGSKFQEALPFARKLYSEYPVQRNFILLAQSLLLSGRYEEMEEHLSTAEEKAKSSPQFLFMQAQMLLYTGKRTEALEKFKQIYSDTEVRSVQLYNEIGRTLLIGGLAEEALKYYRKSLELDPENAPALAGAGLALTEMNRFEEALLQLESSLLQTYYQPNVHFLIGLCLYKLKRTEEAVKALKICLHFAPRHQKAKNLMEVLNGEKAHLPSKPVIIVSGLPRSGTSLMMQMLKAAGIRILTDKEREEDTYNPEGYMEYSPVKKIGISAEWIKKASGKAVKVVSPLLRYLPADQRYKIIYMQRPLTEVVLSQEVMKGERKEQVMKNFPFQAAANLQNEEKRTEQWLALQSNIDLQKVSYHDCLNHPAKVMESIGKFLQWELKSREAATAVRMDLYRNRI